MSKQMTLQQAKEIVKRYKPFAWSDHELMCMLSCNMILCYFLYQNSSHDWVIQWCAVTYGVCNMAVAITFMIAHLVMNYMYNTALKIINRYENNQLNALNKEKKQ